MGYSYTKTYEFFLLELSVILTQNFTLFTDCIEKKHFDLFPSKKMKEKYRILLKITPSPPPLSAVDIVHTGRGLIFKYALCTSNIGPL